MPRILARLFFWIACLASLAGAGRTLASLPFGFEAPAEHPGWVARYGELASRLEGVPRALFVADDPGGTPKYKLFRAQFVLGPTVLLDRPSLDAVRPRQLVSVPLVLDASTAEGLEAALAHLRERSIPERVELIVERAPRRLAVVRARAAAR